MFAARDGDQRGDCAHRAGHLDVYKRQDDDCDRHFHVMCSRCGNMFHVDCELAGQLAEHLFAEHGFRVDPRASVLVGLCKDCQKGGNEHGPDGAEGCHRDL